jgi:hypothetical protein
MRFVGLKSQEPLDMQTLQRSRDRLVGERTALINQVRAILLERAIVAPQGKRKLEQFLTVLMDEQRGAGLSPRMITRVADARARHCGVRQQARQDRLGGAPARRKVRRQGTALGGLVVGRGRAEAR